MLGNIHDAEDIAQQALLKGLTDISELRDSERFGAWIGRITKNLCIDFLRRQKYQGNASVEQSSGFDARPQVHDEVRTALAKLPEEYRLVLMLYYFDGRSAKNIAEALVISEAAVHTRMSRARKQYILRPIRNSQRVFLLWRACQSNLVRSYSFYHTGWGGFVRPGN